MDEVLYKEHYEVQGKHWWFSAKKKIVISLIEKFTLKRLGNKLLDVGVGSGLMLNALESFGEVSGMDYSDDAILFSKMHFNGVIKKGELPHSVPFENNSFNILVALDVVEHVENDLEALKVLRRLLVKDGCGILTVPAFMCLWSDHDDVNHHKRRYSLPEFKEKILAAGFKIEKISYYNTFLFPIIYLIRNFHRLLNIKSGANTKLPKPLINFVLFKIFLFENILLKYINLPFGVSLLAVVTNPDDFS